MDLERLNRKFEIELKDTLDQLQEVIKENDQVRKNLVDLEMKNQNLTQLQDAANETIKKSLLDFEDLSVKLQGKIGKCRNYKKEIISMKEILTALQSEKENLQSEKENLESEKENLQSEKENLESEKENLQSENKNLQSERENLQSEKENLQSENKNLQSEKENIESQNKYLQSENKNLKSENENLQSSLKANQNSITPLKNPENLQILTLSDSFSIKSKFFSKNSPELSLSSFEIQVSPERPSTSLYFFELFDIELTTDSINKLKESMKNSSLKLKLLEAAYKKIEAEFSSFKSHSQDKQDDLKLEKYELSKENDDLKRKINIFSEESKQISSELSKKDIKIKEILSEKAEIELQLSKISSELNEKSKKIQELSQELTNSSNYVQKILKEKESTERNLENMTRTVKNI
jgi:chromosome segregation ATPase